MPKAAPAAVSAAEETPPPQPDDAPEEAPTAADENSGPVGELDIQAELQQFVDDDICQPYCHSKTNLVNASPPDIRTVVHQTPHSPPLLPSPLPRLAQDVPARPP